LEEVEESRVVDDERRGDARGIGGTERQRRLLLSWAKDERERERQD
jgi:hypothetical protein